MIDARAQELYAQISELHGELRDHAQEVADPKCAALCETGTEVVGGLGQAFKHFLNKSEAVWK